MSRLANAAVTWLTSRALAAADAVDAAVCRWSREIGGDDE